MLNRIADALEVSVSALTTNLDTSIGILHSLFALEDEAFFHIGVENGKTVIYLDETEKSDSAMLLRQMLRAWLLQSLRFQKGKITKEEYDNWRYHFPEGFEQQFAKRDFFEILSETQELTSLLSKYPEFRKAPEKTDFSDDMSLDEIEAMWELF